MLTSFLGVPNMAHSMETLLERRLHLCSIVQSEDSIDILEPYRAAGTVAIQGTEGEGQIPRGEIFKGRNILICIKAVVIFNFLGGENFSSGPPCPRLQA